MAAINSLDEYFTQIVPQQYANALAGAADNVLAQPELTVVCEVTGPNGGVYSLRASGAQLYVQSGDQIDHPDVRMGMSFDDWRSLSNSDAVDLIVDYVRRQKVSVVKGLKGRVQLELTQSDGSIWRSDSIFGGQSEPAVTLHMNNDDYLAMMSGDLNGQMAFLTGKLRFEGSLPLLMQVSALSS